MDTQRRQVLKGALACAAAIGGGSLATRYANASGPTGSVAVGGHSQPLKGMRVAVTTDDMALLRGMPHSPGHNPLRTARAFVDAFANHKITGVYQFSNAVPFDDDPKLLKALDIWTEAGHFVGNHGYHHAPLDRMQAVDYAHDIERAESTLRRYIDAAPRRYFRYAAYQLGNTRCKVDSTLGQLVRLNYTPAPVTVGFDDALFIMPHVRVSKYGTAADSQRLWDSYVECAVDDLKVARENAQKIFHRDPSQIWLIHGTSIAAECVDRILSRFADEGVTFISLDEAMLDPMNTVPPPIVTTTFMFHVQMWRIATGTPVDFPKHPALDEAEKLFPKDGEMTSDMFKQVLSRMDAKWTAPGLRPDQDC